MEAEIAAEKAAKAKGMEVGKKKGKQEKENQGKEVAKQGKNPPKHGKTKRNESSKRHLRERGKNASDAIGEHATQVSLELILPGLCKSFNLLAVNMI